MPAPLPCFGESEADEETPPSYSLEEVLRKFAEQEARLNQVITDLTAETSRHSRLVEKLENAVWDQLPEDSVPQSSGLPPLVAHSNVHGGHSSLFRAETRKTAAAASTTFDPPSLGPMPREPPGKRSIFKAADKWWKSFRHANKQLESEEQGVGFTGILRNFLSSFMADVALGFVIAANMAVMFCEHQWSGYEGAMALGYRTDDAGWADAEPVFHIIEIIFVSIYLLDVILRVTLLPLDRLRQPLNLFDTIVVVVCAVDVYILRPAGLADLEALVVLRLVRAARILRVVRVLRFMKLFQNLHVLIETLSSMVLDLFWGSLLLATIVVTAGLFVGTLVHGYILDDSLDLTTREFLYERFAHASSASYYLFEAAMTSAWINSSGPMIFDVSSLFAIFWIPYVVTVNFAVTRVIAALFLKQTLEVAAREKDKVANEAKRKKEKIATRLRQVFKLADESGDGFIPVDDFQRMLDEPEVLEHLETMDLNHNEIRALVDLLSEGGKPVQISDFLHAALTMNENARTIHMMQTAIDVARVEKLILQMSVNQSALMRRIGRRTPPVSLTEEAVLSAV